MAEKAKLVAVVPFSGKWKDLGTWNTLTDELEDHVIGNVITDGEAEIHISLMNWIFRLCV